MNRQLNYIQRQVVNGTVSKHQASLVVGGHWKVNWEEWRWYTHPTHDGRWVRDPQSARLSYSKDAEQLYAVLLLQQTRTPTHERE